MGLAGALRAGTGLLRAPANHGLWSHVALTHRHDGAGAVLPGGDAGSGRDARDLAGCIQLFGIGGTLATLLVCVALLYLVLRIPGIVHRFALRPMMDASRSVAGAATGTVGVVADVAPRLLALL